MSDIKIPKVIHYCWFGKNEKPDIVKKCIASWKKYCSDWEIKEWNEDNFDVTSIPYMKEAYEAKKWAFVSDVARLLIIYQSGGVYLDTDVEVLQSINTLLDNEAFFAFETGRNINTGMGFGSVKEHAVVKEMIRYYNDKHFFKNGKEQLFLCPAGNTEALINYYPEFIRNGCGQFFAGIRILSGAEYSVYAKHYGTASWVNNPQIKKSKFHASKIKAILRNHNIFEWIESKFGKKAVSWYTLLVYDFLDFGLGYFVKRQFVKLVNRKR